jgi:hypothetical protein
MGQCRENPVEGEKVLRAPNNEILNELNQLITQYREEIPGGRRAWPQSIQSRVRILFNQGMSIARIADGCAMSYHTVLNWIPKEERQRDRHQRRARGMSAANFSEVQIRQEKAIATVTVPVRVSQRAKSSEPSLQTERCETAAVTVTLPGGIRVDGVTAEFLKAWIGQGNPS